MGKRDRLMDPPNRKLASAADLFMTTSPGWLMKEVAEFPPPQIL